MSTASNVLPYTSKTIWSNAMVGTMVEYPWLLAIPLALANRAVWYYQMVNGWSEFKQVWIKFIIDVIAYIITYVCWIRVASLTYVVLRSQWRSTFQHKDDGITFRTLMWQTPANKWNRTAIHICVLVSVVAFITFNISLELAQRRYEANLFPLQNYADILANGIESVQF